jgi:hypothetical protein
MQLTISDAGFGWHLQLDNPTFLGWSVVAFYGLAAMACGRAAVRVRARRGPGQQRGQGAEGAGMWWALALALGFLGVNKQLNLQSLFLAAGRHVAAAGGWYNHRRAVQLAFSLMFGLGVCLALVWLQGRQRGFFKQNPLALRGALILGLFVALRAATMNHTNEFLGISLQDKAWAWVLEIGGSVLIAMGALLPQRSSEM